MYHGEVNVAQEELNSFLSVAEELKVKGLTQSNQTSSNHSSEELPNSNPIPKYPQNTLSHSNNSQFKKNQKESIQNRRDTMHEVVSIKPEPKENPQQPVDVVPYDTTPIEEDYGITPGTSEENQLVSNFQEETYEEYEQFEEGSAVVDYQPLGNDQGYNDV